MKILLQGIKSNPNCVMSIDLGSIMLSLMPCIFGIVI